jgi:hypothetical protein
MVHCHIVIFEYIEMAAANKVLVVTFRRKLYTMSHVARHTSVCICTPVTVLFVQLKLYQPSVCVYVSEASRGNPSPGR